MWDQLVASVHTAQYKHRHTFMPLVRFEPTIPMFERVKAFRALDGAATGIDTSTCYTPQIANAD
jgi:hypothetical protein